MWEFINRVLSDPMALTVIAGVVAAAYTLVKSTEWWQLRVEAKYGRIQRIFESAAANTYTEYVQELKRRAEDGKLTIEEVREARSRTLDTAKKIAAERGLDLGRELLPGEQAAYIEKAVSALKACASAA